MSYSSRNSTSRTFRLPDDVDAAIRKYQQDHRFQDMTAAVVHALRVALNVPPEAPLEASLSYASSHAKHGVLDLPLNSIEKAEAEPKARARSKASDRGQYRQASLLGTEAKVERTWNQLACEDWIARFGGTAPGSRITKALRPLEKLHGWEVVRPAWQRFLAEQPEEYVTPEAFAGKFGVWAGTAAAARSRGGKEEQLEALARWAERGEDQG